VEKNLPWLTLSSNTAAIYLWRHGFTRKYFSVEVVLIPDS
jgi:hypothetical protein